ncbi:MAG TPA: right-handed parallel beta-helix repeat-containing protein [Kofleriaceae bacterium]|nr:right-handed parallel beta-helix repeat-containing protein [Kofleriaceae bacterium]
MQRLARVVVLLVLLAACRQFNPESCENPSNAGIPPCGMPDGPPVDTSCKDDMGCSATPDLPVCKIADAVGTCVQCTPEKHAKCSGTMPICTDNRCAPCTRHGDCTDSNVCKPDGSCALESDVAYVDGTAGKDQMVCSKSMPCTKIASAVMTGRAIVKVSGTVTEPTSLDNKSAVILGDLGATLAPLADAVALEVRGTSRIEIFDLSISHPPGAAAREGVTVQDTAELRMTRVGVVNNPADGIRISGGKLTCTRCTIAQNTLLGIDATGGTIAISQSTIQNNLDGGIAVSGMDTGFQIVGNVIFHNGKPDMMMNTTIIPGSGTGGINVPQVRGLATNRIDFNSISRNDARPLFAPGVQCISSPTPLTARYNIIWDNGTSPAFRDQVNATGCDHKFSDIGPLPTSYGMMNVNTDPLFMDELAGDLHLMKPVNVMLFANPSASDIAGPAARDIEDELRSVATEMGADHVAR